MAKIFSSIQQALKNFFVNPFWRTWSVLVLFFLALVINGILWYIYATRIKQNPNPIIFASGVIVLNAILANYLWNREKMAGIFLLIIMLTIEIFILAFVRYLIVF
ncbi:MAG: hypothetical protein ABSE91_03360 [Patescibacteria group bacterium]|jgi:uncharacterized membrane protein HdeD (DUF308 family)